MSSACVELKVDLFEESPCGNYGSPREVVCAGIATFLDLTRLIASAKSRIYRKSAIRPEPVAHQFESDAGVREVNVAKEPFKGTLIHPKTQADMRYVPQ